VKLVSLLEDKLLLNTLQVTLNSRQTSYHQSVMECVTNSLQGKIVWMITERDTLEKTHVLSVRSIFHLKAAYVSIWILIEVNTSAQNVANAVTVVSTWQHTDEVIQERNRLNVLFVANNSHWLETLLSTAEFTVERYHTNVTCVTRRLVSLDICTVTWESTQERNHTNVTCVTRRLVCL